MVVDDEVGRLRLICLFLKRAGFVPLAMRNTEAAQEALETLAPDCFIVSADLEDNAGLNLCKELKQSARYGKSPLLLLVMRGDECVALRHVRVDDYISIPFVSFELIQKVQALLAA